MRVARGLFCSLPRPIAAVVAVCSLAIASALVPSTAHAAEGDSWVEGGRYHRILLQRGVVGLETERWTAACPSSYQYLDVDAGSDGRSVGKGIKVDEPGGVSVVEGGEELGIPSRNKRTYRTINGRRYYTGNGGTATNWAWLTTKHTYVEMVCTADLAKAWNEPGPGWP